MIVHLLDLYPPDGSDPADNYRTIRGELESFSQTLAEKREIIVANKLDLAIDEEAIDKLRADLAGKEIFAISGVSRTGLDPLLEQIWTVVKEARIANPRDLTLELPDPPVAKVVEITEQNDLASNT